MEYHQFHCPRCCRQFSWGTLQKVVHKPITRENAYGHYCLECHYDDTVGAQGPIVNRWTGEQQRQIEEEAAYAVFSKSFKVLDRWTNRYKAYKATNANTVRRLTTNERWDYTDIDPACQYTGRFEPLLVTKAQAEFEATSRNVAVASSMLLSVQELLATANSLAPIVHSSLRRTVILQRIKTWAHETEHGTAAAEVLRIIEGKDA